MGVSALDSLFQIPGFRDRLGERVIVPQPSGALLEYLYFCDALATAPFFAQALKDRVARLSTFTHSSYCRVRRVQFVAERDGRPALVSAHVAGRRLAEILDVAARAEVKPPTAGVLAVTRQMMSSVALLHDFSPDGFHGALGPDRLILAGEGRVVIAEHVLGTVIEQAVSAWGVTRLWSEYRLATRRDPDSAQYSRRNDVMQVGLVTLAMLLGRPLGSTEYPDEIGRLLQELTETKPDGARVPVRPGLCKWLERTLALPGSSSYRTLLESQKALAQLVQDDGYEASPAVWDAFVGICETAAVRVPVVMAVPEPVPAAGGATRAAVEEAAEPAADGPSGSGEEAAARVCDEPETTVREDPLGPWPAAEPGESAATPLEAFPAETPLSATAELMAFPSEATPDETAASKSWAPSPAARMQPETLFESPRHEPAPVAAAPNAAPPAETIRGVAPKEPVSQATSVADWHTLDPKIDLSYAVVHGERRPNGEAGFADERADDVAMPDPMRRTHLLILAVLTVMAVAAGMYAPYLWSVVYEGRWKFGSVTVESDPPGATITVDGRVRGHTPAELTLRAGEHLLEIQSGGSAKSKTISISAHGKLAEKMTFPDAGERGGLRISTYPTTGRITIDGVPRGPAPVKVTDLTPGTHTMVVETPLGTQEEDVVVQPGRVSQLAVPTASWVKVTAPYELRVYEAGRMFGTTGKAPVMVPPGRHYVEFSNPALGLKLRQFIDAVPGQLVVVPIELPAGTMNLFADRAAEVYVDGQKVGDTPLTSLSVPLGSHEVVFRNATYGEVKYTVAVTLAAPVRLNVTFRK
ncbi:MAG TPA: PEGA domain-containing protein [Vicinamibacterales bacterium]